MGRKNHFVVALGGLAAALAIHPTSAVRAQELRYRTYLVGERALGMGGAFTGVADDASAAYYNPAGLAHVASTSLSGSLSVDAYNDWQVSQGYGSAIGVQTLRYSARPSVPIFASVVYKFGKRDPTRVRPHALGISTFHPIQRRDQFNVDVRNDATQVHDWLSIRSDETMTWYGPSYAYRPSPTLAFGLSAFLSTRAFHHEEYDTIVTEGTCDDFGSCTNATVSVRQPLVEIEAKHIVLRAGGAWDPTPRLRLGLMVQPPGIGIGAKSRVAELTVFGDTIADPPYLVYQAPDQSGLPAEYPIPWEVRAGVSYAPTENETFALDVSVHGATGTADDPVKAFGDGRPDPVSGLPPRPPDYLAQTWYRKMTANVAVGGETLLFGIVPLRAGFFTNFSPVPEPDAYTNVYSPAHVDAYGATLSVGIRSGGYDVSVGAAGLLGWGTGLGTNPDRGDSDAAHPETYVERNVRERVLYFFLSGAKQASSRLARAAYGTYVEGH